MADAKKTIIRIGERKDSSARRSSKRKKNKRRDIRWLHVLVAAIVTSALLFMTYHLIFKKNIFRFEICGGNKAYHVCLPEGHSIFGLDISHHQGEIKWDKLTAGQSEKAPLKFVYIKATEGRDHEDTRFGTNWKEAKEHGFLRGAYHYFTAASSGDAQANKFIKTVKLEKGDLPPMVDIEEIPEDKETFILELKKFILRLEEHYGVKPLIYSYPKFHNKYLDEPFFWDYELWIAHYNAVKPESNREWIIWQFTEKGKVPGIKHKVDINVIKDGERKLQELLLK